MDSSRLAVIRQLLNETTVGPTVGLMFSGIYVSTDWDHRQQDAAFYRQARWIMLELLAEVERLQTETQHSRYAASVSKVLAVEAERDALKAELANVRPTDREWLHPAGNVQYVDG